MFYVYILKSKINIEKYYVGITNDLYRRVKQHNLNPSCSYTIKYTPWMLETYIVFQNYNQAHQFEKYLKTHSGKAFLTKRLI